jgi:hypothetical protein
MIITTNSSGLIADGSNETYQSKCLRITLEAGGLKPFTKHDIYFDGILYNFATKPFGCNLGEPLITDERGFVKFESLYEHPFEGTYSYENINDLDKKDGGSTSRFVKTSMLIELRGNDSYGSFLYPKNIYVIPAHVTRPEDHGH